jgi:RNA polymerase sigma-70 factor, ECF subfamily
LEDRELVQGALAGRPEDFEALVERHQRALYAFVWRLLRDDDAADEVVQAAFVQAYTNLARFRGEASFKTWLHQIALNQCRSLRRAGRGRREVALDDVDEASLVDRREAEASPGWRRHLESLVARLPPRQRAVLSLRLFADLRFQDIARAEGITVNTAKVTYHNAVLRLRQWLKREDS